VRARGLLPILGCAVLLAAFSAGDSPVVTGGYGNRTRRNFIGVFQPDTARWTLRMLRPGWVGNPPADLQFTYGHPGDTPLVGDWDGDGAQTQGAWRAGLWSLSNRLGSGVPDLTFTYGRAGDRPVVGDWDGDGVATPAPWPPSRACPTRTTGPPAPRRTCPLRPTRPPPAGGR